MRSQNINVKDVGSLVSRQGSVRLARATNRTAGVIGKISCLSVLGLGVLLVSPLSAYPANAYTEAERTDGYLNSSVNISFTPAEGNTSITPTGANTANKGYIAVLANVGVTNSGGYSVYLGSANTSLVGVKNTSYTVPTLPIGSEFSYDELPNDTWGYSANQGATVDDNAKYKALTKGQGDMIYEDQSTRITNDSKQFALSFAANLSATTPADTYENQVTLSVVSSPYQLTLMDIDNMQDMTSAICENSPQFSTKQLKDIRDGKYYWVTKLADNNCWMTQNLDLDITTAGLLAADTDITEDWNSMSAYPPVDFESSMTLSSIEYNTNTTRSWNFGDYVIINPLVASDCGSGKESIADCPGQFIPVEGMMASSDSNFYVHNNDKVHTDVEYDAHYTVGNYYQWNTATAGTGASLTIGEASGSICAKGWKLPTQMEMNDLTVKGQVVGNVEAFTSNPYYFVRSGSIDQHPQLLSGAGDRGNYWESESNFVDNILRGLSLEFGGTSYILPNHGGYIRYFGFSVRCIAR